MFKIINLTVLFSVLLGITPSAQAGGYLAQGVTVTQIQVGWQNVDGLLVVFSGGNSSAACYSNGYALFYPGGPSNISSSRMQWILQTALSAYLSGKPVDIIDDVDANPSNVSTACQHGTEIWIHN